MAVAVAAVVVAVAAAPAGHRPASLPVPPMVRGTKDGGGGGGGGGRAGAGGPPGSGGPGRAGGTTPQRQGPLSATGARSGGAPAAATAAPSKPTATASGSAPPKPPGSRAPAGGEGGGGGGAAAAEGGEGAADAAGGGGRGGEDGSLTLPDSSGKYNVKVKRQMSAKLKASQVNDLIEKQRQEQKNAQRLAEEAAARQARLKEYESSLGALWVDQWDHVQLDQLPKDVERPNEIGRRGLAERDPTFRAELGDLLLLYFQELFDTYLYYAKVEADASASELYRMTDFNWKNVLRDATVVGAPPGQISTQTVSSIFKFVNQRRDNLEQGKNKASREAKGGAAAGLGAGAGAGLEGEAAAQDITDAVAKAMADSGAAASAAASGFSSPVTRSHYAAGSLYAFTFSEFLEGLIHVALELPPPPNAPPPGPSGLSSLYVVNSVRALLDGKVIPFAKRGNTLEFRKAIVTSGPLNEALASISPMLEPLYNTFAGDTSQLRAGRGGGGLSLKTFLDMCSQSELIGGALSNMQVKATFVNSLKISIDAEDSRKPLLNKGEFMEAVLRLAYAYDLSKDDPSPSNRATGVARGGRAKRAAAESASERAKKDPAVAYTGLIKEAVDGVTPRGGAAAAAGETVAEQVESAILLKLPTVCGKLLALLEEKVKQTLHGAAVS